MRKSVQKFSLSSGKGGIFPRTIKVLGVKYLNKSHNFPSANNVRVIRRFLS